MPKNAVVLTAVVVSAEFTTYNATGQVCDRPRPMQFAVIEADIPKPVADWIRSMQQKVVLPSAP